MPTDYPKNNRSGLFVRRSPTNQMNPNRIYVIDGKPPKLTKEQELRLMREEDRVARVKVPVIGFQTRRLPGE